MAEKTAYTADQVRDADRIARILAGPPSESQRDILTMLGNAFIEGLATGIQLDRLSGKTEKTE